MEPQCEYILHCVYFKITGNNTIYGNRICAFLSCLKYRTPQATVQRPSLSHEEEKEVLEETGKSLEALGQLLQGKDVIATKEGQQQLLDAVKALTTADGVLNEEAAEYFLPIIIRGIAQGAIAHVVHKKLNKRG